jgi:type IV pilus assembly protein PilY1
MGWLIDFPTAEDERVVYSPMIISSRLVFVTNVPSGSTCGSGGTGYLMVVNPTTGGRIDSPVIDISGDGRLTADDRITVAGVQIQVSGKQTAVAPSGTPTIVTGGGGGSIGGPNSAGQGRIYSPDIRGGITPGPLGLAPDTGRVTWREILTP